MIAQNNRTTAGSQYYDAKPPVTPLLAISSSVLTMKKPAAKTILAQNVLALREHRGWSQATLARAAGISQRTVSNIESPDRNPGYSPTLDAVEGIARAFGLASYHLAMPLPLEGLLNQGVEKLLECYARADSDGRESITRVAEMAARYDVNKPKA